MPVTPFILLKLVHILSAITALGANLTYPYWLRRAGRDRDRLFDTMDAIRQLDRRVANPAYGLAFLTGAGMVVTGAYSFQTFWIAAAIALFILVAVLGFTVYAPAIRRQRAEAERDITSGAYAAAARRQTTIGLVVTLLAVTIVVLMVMKPTPG